MSRKYINVEENINAIRHFVAMRSLNISSILMTATRNVRQVYIQLVLLALVAIFIDIFAEELTSWTVALLHQPIRVFAFLLSTMFWGVSIVLVNDADDSERRPNVRRAFRVVFQRIIPLILVILFETIVPSLASFLFFVISGLGLLMQMLGFVVAAVVALYLSVRLFPLSYAVVLENRSPLNALSYSWRITRGRWWSIVGTFIVLGLLLFIPLLFFNNFLFFIMLIQNRIVAQVIFSFPFITLGPVLVMSLYLIYKRLSIPEPNV